MDTGTLVLDFFCGLVGLAYLIIRKEADAPDGVDFWLRAEHLSILHHERI